MRAGCRCTGMPFHLAPNRVSWTTNHLRADKSSRGYSHCLDIHSIQRHFSFFSENLKDIPKDCFTWTVLWGTTTGSSSFLLSGTLYYWADGSDWWMTKLVPFHKEKLCRAQQYKPIHSLLGESLIHLYPQEPTHILGLCSRHILLWEFFLLDQEYTIVLPDWFSVGSGTGDQWG